MNPSVLWILLLVFPFATEAAPPKVHTSAREVDEFIVHPNRFKRELGVGEAVMIVPHEAGSGVVNIKFRKFDNLPTAPIAQLTKSNANKIDHK
jgi:hypothetical protein